MKALVDGCMLIHKALYGDVKVAKGILDAQLDVNGNMKDACEPLFAKMLKAISQAQAYMEVQFVVVLDGHAPPGKKVSILCPSCDQMMPFTCSVLPRHHYGTTNHLVVLNQQRRRNY
jgi:hypothetical protein